MRPRTDLCLVRDNLLLLTETTYYSEALDTFTKKLVEVIEHVLTHESNFAQSTMRDIAAIVRHANTYLSGSTVKEAPYEMEFCLKSALSTWVKRDTIITTALTANQDFHLLPLDIWHFLTNIIPSYVSPSYSPLLVLIGVPRLYKHTPLFCIPLYHELGHFVDLNLGVTNFSLLIDRSSYSGSSDARVEERHRKEHFADLFAACYAGLASIETLETIAPTAAASATHPATSVRSRVVRSFLNGSIEPIVALFQASLQNLSAPSLSVRFSVPNISSEFDDVRPCRIGSDAEMHGIFPASWSYLFEAITQRNKPWIIKDMEESTIETIVNNLAEKSIRNIAIREKWDSGATP